MFAKNVIFPSTRLTNKIAIRCLHHTIQLKELMLKEYGNEFDKCLDLAKTNLDVDLKSSDNDRLFVRLIAAPINPADLNIIQGNL